MAEDTGRLEKYLKVKSEVKDEALRKRVSGIARMTPEEFSKVETEAAGRKVKTVSQVFSGALFDIDGSKRYLQREPNNPFYQVVNRTAVGRFVDMAKAAGAEYIGERMTANALFTQEKMANKYGLSLISGTGRVEENAK